MGIILFALEWTAQKNLETKLEYQLEAQQLAMAESKCYAIMCVIAFFIFYLTAHVVETIDSIKAKFDEMSEE